MNNRCKIQSDHMNNRLRGGGTSGRSRGQCAKICSLSLRNSPPGSWSVRHKRSGLAPLDGGDISDGDQGCHKLPKTTANQSQPSKQTLRGYGSSHTKPTAHSNRRLKSTKTSPTPKIPLLVSQLDQKIPHQHIQNPGGTTPRPVLQAVTVRVTHSWPVTLLGHV